MARKRAATAPTTLEGPNEAAPLLEPAAVGAGNVATGVLEVVVNVKMLGVVEVVAVLAVDSEAVNDIVPFALTGALPLVPPKVSPMMYGGGATASDGSTRLPTPQATMVLLSGWIWY